MKKDYSSAAWASDMPLEWFYVYNVSGSSANIDPHEMTAKMPYTVAENCYRLSHALMVYASDTSAPLHKQRFWQDAVTAAANRCNYLELIDFTGPECL